MRFFFFLPPLLVYLFIYFSDYGVRDLTKMLPSQPFVRYRSGRLPMVHTSPPSSPELSCLAEQKLSPLNTNSPYPVL